MSFLLVSNGINLLIPNNAQVYSGMKEYQTEVIVFLRACVSGEELTESGECLPCPAGFFLIQAPTVPTACIQCNTVKEICLGGGLVGPKPGYWRKSSMTDNFLNCPVASSCLGMIAPDYNPMGDCAP